MPFLPAFWGQSINTGTFLPLLADFSRVYPITTNKLHSSRRQMSCQLVDKLITLEGFSISLAE
jgi:hypothetical protein